RRVPGGGARGRRRAGRRPAHVAGAETGLPPHQPGQRGAQPVRPEPHLRGAEGDREGRRRRRRRDAHDRARGQRPRGTRRRPPGGARLDRRPSRARRGPARGLRLHLDRADRLRLATLPPRATAADDQAAGQGRGPPVRRLIGGQSGPAPPSDAARPGPHDGRRAERRRGRDQPNALRRRAALRRLQVGPRGRRQGPGPDRHPDPPDRQGERRRGRQRPAARAGSAQLDRGRPGDPGRALRGRRPRARVRLPDGRAYARGGPRRRRRGRCARLAPSRARRAARRRRACAVNEAGIRRLLRHTDLLAAAAVVMVVTMLVVPLPAAVLDLLITLNISAALMIVVATMYLGRALDFSSFPSLLLLTTMFRLAINVSVTRLILTTGDAGSVVKSFGEFVVGGNVVVGLVIFLILIVIQFVVVTNGAGRVAEVGARFTLDAMPGKQMAIDADLNAGL